MNVNDIPESEIFMFHELGEFKIKLHNGHGIGDVVIDFTEWMNRNFD